MVNRSSRLRMNWLPSKGQMAAGEPAPVAFPHRTQRWTGVRNDRKRSAVGRGPAILVVALVLFVNLSAPSQAFSFPAGGAAAVVAKARGIRSQRHHSYSCSSPSAMTLGRSGDGGGGDGSSCAWGARMMLQHHNRDHHNAAEYELTTSTCLGSTSHLALSGAQPSDCSWHGRPISTLLSLRNGKITRTRAAAARSTSSRSLSATKMTAAGGESQPPPPVKKAAASHPLFLPEGSTMLTPGDPIEFWHAKSLALGNFVGAVPGRRSLSVLTEFGESLTIDAGQIVGLWQEREMRDSLPKCLEDWAKVRESSNSLLQDMPTSGLNLDSFWLAASSKGKGFVVTPAHAAEFLFKVNKFELGLKKQRPFQFQRYYGSLLLELYCPVSVCRTC